MTKKKSPSVIPFAVADLGDLVREKITGYTGIVVAVTRWLNGCDRLTVQPRDLDKENKPQPTETFDIYQLEVLEIASVPAGKPDTGGPRPAPVKHKDVTR